MSSPRWPVVIFDLDGTLVDSIGLIVASYQHAFTTVLGHPWDEAEIKTWIGQSLYGAMQRVSPERADEIFAAYTTWNEANTERLLAVYPGIPDMLRDLAAAGVRMGIATSKRDAPALMAMQLTGIGGLIPLLVHHDSVDEHKPSPKAVLLASSMLDAEVADCVYVGDAAVDVVAAHNAGMQSVAVRWGAGTPEAIAEAEPTVTCDTVAELRAVLLGEPV